MNELLAIRDSSNELNKITAKMKEIRESKMKRL
jgi:hypothetical protein